VVEERGGGWVRGGLGNVGRAHKLPQQHTSPGLGHRGVQRFQLLEHFVQVEETLLEHLWLMCEVENGLADSSNSLAGWLSWEVDGQVGKTENAHERHEAFL